MEAAFNKLASEQRTADQLAVFVAAAFIGECFKR
jgi:hypothetical protein